MRTTTCFYITTTPELGQKNWCTFCLFLSCETLSDRNDICSRSSIKFLFNDILSWQGPLRVSGGGACRRSGHSLVTFCSSKNGSLSDVLTFIAKRAPQSLQNNSSRWLPTRWMDYRWGDFSLTWLCVQFHVRCISKGWEKASMENKGKSRCSMLWQG